MDNHSRAPGKTNFMIMMIVLVSEIDQHRFCFFSCKSRRGGIGWGASSPFLIIFPQFLCVEDSLAVVNHGCASGLLCTM
jgi:hypothetical protein